MGQIKRTPMAEDMKVVLDHVGRVLGILEKVVVYMNSPRHTVNNQLFVDKEDIDKHLKSVVEE